MHVHNEETAGRTVGRQGQISTGLADTGKEKEKKGK